MLNLRPTNQYKKDRKLAIKRGLPMSLLDEVLQTLMEEKAVFWFWRNPPPASPPQTRNTRLSPLS